MHWIASNLNKCSGRTCVPGWSWYEVHRSHRQHLAADQIIKKWSLIAAWHFVGPTCDAPIAWLSQKFVRLQFPGSKRLLRPTTIADYFITMIMVSLCQVSESLHSFQPLHYSETMDLAFSSKYPCPQNVWYFNIEYLHQYLR